MKQPTFFDKYPHEYDWLTDEQARLPKHNVEVQGLIQEFKPTRVLDAGCGTGLTSYLFASHGVTSVGLDRSAGMLAVAELKYSGKDLPLSFKSARFEALPKSTEKQFDLLVCLANSLSGVGSLANLRKTLRGFRSVLAPGGHCVLQLLNIAGLRDGSHNVVRSTEHDDILYLRFLSRRGPRVMLTLVRVDTRTSPAQFEPFITEYEPFDLICLSAELKKAGFVDASAFGDLNLSQKFRQTSRDLVLVARRP